MDENSLISSISEYETQLAQIELAISATSDTEERNSLIDLRNDINQLLSLTRENLSVLQDKQEASSSKTNEPSNDRVTDEYAVFMAEMKQIGAVDNGESSDDNSNEKPNIKEELSSLEGMKCQAPHDHHFGGTVYHNALVCSVVTSDEEQSFEDIKVRIMFTNPTHQEMLPCPYFLESECKFSIEQCRFSHGEIVSLSSLKEYKEPDFAKIKVGSQVLAKQISNKLWHRAKVTGLGNNTCEVQFESNKHRVDVSLADVMPLENTEEDRSDTESSNYSENEEEVDTNLIEQSLVNQPASQAIGDWEKHTKGIGSKLLQQMGYVVGTGLGKNSDGRIEPVEAVILPTGKSLDHCMKLKEKAGGDENLFKVEKRLKKLKRKQEERNKKAYDKAKQKTDVFEFLNNTFGSKPILKTNDPTKPGFSKSTHRKDLGKESNRNLNVCGLKVEEDIRKVERDIWKINETLTRHTDERSVMNKNLKTQLETKQTELRNLKLCERNITNEQTLRKDKKKLTIF